MNFAFLFSGTVSTNAQIALLTGFLLVTGYNAGRYGLDKWVIPFLISHNPAQTRNQKKEVVVA